MCEAAVAIRHLEQAVLGATWTQWIVLRYGVFYGPGHVAGPGDEQFDEPMGRAVASGWLEWMFAGRGTFGSYVELDPEGGPPCPRLFLLMSPRSRQPPTEEAR